MTAWVDCRTGPSWFGGWAADMGEYIGPWPIMPTGVLDGLDPATFDAIDFVLGYDNPAHPGDPFYALDLDDTYDSPIWDVERSMTAGGTPSSGMSWSTSSVGAADAPDGSTPPPAGVHLWVVAFLSDDSVPPTVAPESYVPSTYCAAGTAAAQTLPGRWSDPQSGFPVSRSGVTITENRWSNIDSESVPDDTASNLSLAQAAAAADLAAAVWSNDADGDQSFDGTRAPVEFFSGGTSSQVKAGQRAWAFEPSAMDNPAPDFSGMVYGVDYGNPPFGPVAYQYLSDPSFTEWASDTIDGITETFYRGRALAGADLDMYTGWLVQQIDALPEDGDTGAIFGTTLLTLAVGGPGTPTDSAAGAPWSVDIPTGAGAPLVLVGTPKFLVDGVDIDFAPEIPEPGAAGIVSFITLDPDHNNALGYTYEAGTWRYWIPGGIGPTGPFGFWGIRA